MQLQVPPQRAGVGSAQASAPRPPGRAVSCAEFPGATKLAGVERECQLTVAPSHQGGD